MARVGMALTFAIVIGLSACLGTLIPLLALHRDVLFSSKRPDGTRGDDDHACGDLSLCKGRQGA